MNALEMGFFKGRTFFMDKNTFIQLAKDAYRLTLLFPNREPLRYKIREVADDIVACFVVKGNLARSSIL